MQVITVSSFKGGTAKTSTSLHIASALSLFHNKRVLVVDFDAQANLTTGFGFDPDEYDSLAPVLQDKKNVNDVILKTPCDGVDIIPADTWLERVEVSDKLASDRYSHEKLKKILIPLSSRYDFVFIDTPPSLCWLTESAMIASDHVLISATPEFYSVKGLQRLSFFVKHIRERHPLHIIGVLLSFWNTRGKNNEGFIDVIGDVFPGKLFSTKIRRDIAISESSIAGKPVFLTNPSSRGSHDFKEVTKELLARLAKEVE